MLLTAGGIGATVVIVAARVITTSVMRVDLEDVADELPFTGLCCRPALPTNTIGRVGCVDIGGACRYGRVGDARGAHRLIRSVRAAAIDGCGGTRRIA